MLKTLWESMGFQLLYGILGIYSCYWVAGILQQKILKRPYQIDNSVQWELFQSPILLLYLPAGFAWVTGFLINSLFYSEHAKMPSANLIACSVVVCISTHTYALAIYITNFPIVMMVKSCNIVSVVLVGVFCSRVRDKALHLGPKKILVAALISTGILLFNFGGNQTHKDKATDPLGLILLVISMVADGFLPDFQAVIKSEYNPRPIQMFEHINKWVCILSFTYALITGQLFYMIDFGSRHPELWYDILGLSFLTTLGQIFVYRMIKQFKQHIVPFVITTRKIFTVVISIFFYNHQTTIMQILAIALVFITASYQYLSELYYSRQNTSNQNQNLPIKPSEHQDTRVSDDQINMNPIKNEDDDDSENDD